MAFNFVNWAPRTPVSWDRLLQMSNNDQHLLDEINSLRSNEIAELQIGGPKGRVGHGVGSTFTSGTRSWNTIPGLSVTWTAEAGRYYKASLSIPMAYTTGDSTAVGLWLVLNGTGIGDWYVHVNKNWISSIGTITKVFTTGAGERTLQARMRSGREGTNCTIKGHNADMTLLVEDIGPV